jgi:hypothetical protein
MLIDVGTIVLILCNLAPEVTKNVHSGVDD